MNKPEKHRITVDFYDINEVDTYLTDLLAPLKSEWESFKHILCDKYTCAYVTTIEPLKAIKPIAERLNW